MDNLPDFDLQPTAAAPPPVEAPPSRSIGLRVVVGVLVAAAAGAAYVLFGMRPNPASPAATKPPVAAAKASPAQALGGEGAGIVLPPLDDTDPLVRTLVRALSQSPAVTAWLATTGLIRNFTVVVTNIADGATPVKHLTALRPSSPFRVMTRDGRVLVDPRGYDRYTTIGNAVASIDPGGAARLYATLKPRIEDAYRQLGLPQPSFDRVLERAIVILLNTPVVELSAPLRRQGIGYAYADNRLEDLTDAQKQLLRLGPDNVRIIKEQLRAIALALGISSGALPGSR